MTASSPMRISMYNKVNDILSLSKLVLLDSSYILLYVLSSSLSGFLSFPLSHFSTLALAYLVVVLYSILHICAVRHDGHLNANSIVYVKRT